MELGVDGGSYHYEKIGVFLTLRGDLTRDEAITLDEIIGDDKKTGTFKGRFTKSRQTLEGTWSSADRKKKIIRPDGPLRKFMPREGQDEGPR
jgi:hypothetical protein